MKTILLELKGRQINTERSVCMPIDGRNMKSSPRRLERLKRSGAIGTIMDSVEIYGRNSFTGSGHWDFDPQYREQKKRLRKSSKEIIEIEIEFEFED